MGAEGGPGKAVWGWQGQGDGWGASKHTGSAAERGPSRARGERVSLLFQLLQLPE